MESEFDLLARYYDLDQAGYTDDIPFYLSLAQRCGSPIFELGCGTGRLLVPLAQAGYQITGVDVSPAMLDIARQKVAKAGLEERVILVQADMRSMALPGRYRLGICGLYTLLHVACLPDQSAVLKTAFRHLDSGGILALDLPNPHTSMLTEEQAPVLLEKEIMDPLSGHRIFKLYSHRTDLSTQTTESTWIYDEMDAQGGVRRTVIPLRMRWLYPYEAQLLMEAAGFTVEQIYGSYELEPFDAHSEHMILIGHVP